MPVLKEVLQESLTEDILKGACWTISNIIEGSASHIQAVLDSGIMTSIFTMLEQEMDIRREAIWAICNLTYSGTIEQIQTLMQMYPLFLSSILEHLKSPDIHVVEMVLAFLENILYTSLQLEGNPYKFLLLNSVYYSAFVGSIMVRAVLIYPL